MFGSRFCEVSLSEKKPTIENRSDTPSRNNVPRTSLFAIFAGSQSDSPPIPSVFIMPRFENGKRRESPPTVRKFMLPRHSSFDPHTVADTICFYLVTDNNIVHRLPPDDFAGTAGRVKSDNCGNIKCPRAKYHYYCCCYRSTASGGFFFRRNEPENYFDKRKKCAVRRGTCIMYSNFRVHDNTRLQRSVS